MQSIGCILTFPYMGIILFSSASVRVCFLLCLSPHPTDTLGIFLWITTKEIVVRPAKGAGSWESTQYVAALAGMKWIGKPMVDGVQRYLVQQRW